MLSTAGPAPVNATGAVRVSVIVLAYQRDRWLVECLRSLEQNVPQEIPHETIVVSNGLEVDAFEEEQRRFPSVRFVFSEVNLGFAGGCNRGVRHARGDYIALLNDDAEIEPGWLEAMLESMEAESDVGAVGSRILRLDGTVQEAGSVMWSTGSAAAVGRDLPAGSTAYGYRRQVDYCSAASLLVARKLWDEVGGLDEEYHPAYYEDADFCFALRARGYRVIYEPRSRVRHTESSSTESHFRGFLFDRNRHRFRQKWSEALADCEPPPEPHHWEAGIARAVHRARGQPRRILVIDDFYPDPALGSGLPRALSMIDELRRFSAVAFLATSPMHGDPAILQGLGVEPVNEALEDHLRRPELLYSTIIVSRPHNFERSLPLLRRWQPQAPIVYDAEALFHLRLQRQAGVLDDGAVAQAAAAMQAVEQTIAATADRVVCISEAEASVLRSVPGHAPIDVIEPRRLEARWTTDGFVNRRDALLVAGWLAGPTSPNADGLVWFAQEVVPHLLERVPWARVNVTGANPPENVVGLGGPTIRLLGHVADLGQAYRAARVAIVPLRFGSGVKNKTMEALLHGLPVVATTCGAEGIDCRGRPAIDVADDPKEFAERLALLLEKPAAWEQRRTVIRELVQEWDGEPAVSWKQVINEVLDGRR